jgi:hypothetical protein
VRPEPEALGAYLAEKHPSDLIVTDSARKQLWIHSPQLVGDSLVGVVQRDDTRVRRGVPLRQVVGLATPRFSVGHTIGLAGVVVGSTAVAVWILTTKGPRPVIQALVK